MHPIVMEELVKAHLSDLQEEAEQSRPISSRQLGQPSVIDRLLVKLGELLTKAGGQLQARRALQHTGKLESTEKQSAIPLAKARYQ